MFDSKLVNGVIFISLYYITSPYFLMAFYRKFPLMLVAYRKKDEIKMMLPCRCQYQLAY